MRNEKPFVSAVMNFEEVLFSCLIPEVAARKWLQKLRHLCFIPRREVMSLFIGMTKSNSDTLEKIRKTCHRVIRTNFPLLSDRREIQAMKAFNYILASDNLLYAIVSFFTFTHGHNIFSFLFFEQSVDVNPL